MSDPSLSAISPVDGRYRRHTDPLAAWFSEAALIRYRLRIEAEYFCALCEIPLPQLTPVKKDDLALIRDLYLTFSDHDATRVKTIEAETNHDVKAVEYFIKERLVNTPLEPFKEFVHFGLTSQDINNTAMPLMVKGAMEEVMIPMLLQVVTTLVSLSGQWKEIPMLAYTHGQPASPTRLGKELYVFADRLKPMTVALESHQHTGKFGGATGNFNALKAAFPTIDWVQFADTFLHKKLGLQRQKVTTQIEHYDGWAALFHLMIRINTVLLDLNRDIWNYISMNYFRQKVSDTEVGSSAMPHKVNPIDFENSEGNIMMANALFGFLAEKLPVSRLQRDLTDSTVSRNIGVPFAHTLVAWKSLLCGLDKLIVNKEKMKADLDANWAVITEGIQTILRREGIAQPYEMLKDMTRGKDEITKESLHNFIDGLRLPDRVKAELKLLAPADYTGYNFEEMIKS